MHGPEHAVFVQQVAGGHARRTDDSGQLEIAVTDGGESRREALQELVVVAPSPPRETETGQDRRQQATADVARPGTPERP